MSWKCILACHINTSTKENKILQKKKKFNAAIISSAENKKKRNIKENIELAKVQSKWIKNEIDQIVKVHQKTKQQTYIHTYVYEPMSQWANNGRMSAQLIWPLTWTERLGNWMTNNGISNSKRKLCESKKNTLQTRTNAKAHRLTIFWGGSTDLCILVLLCCYLHYLPSYIYIVDIYIRTRVYLFLCACVTRLKHALAGGRLMW